MLETKEVQSLAFSMGVGLPLVSTLPIAVAAVRWLSDAKRLRFGFKRGDVTVK